MVETAGRILSKIDDKGRLKLDTDTRAFRDIESGDVVLVDIHLGTDTGIDHLGSMFDEVDQKGRVRISNSLREQWGLGPGDELLLEAVRVPKARQDQIREIVEGDKRYA